MHEVKHQVKITEDQASGSGKAELKSRNDSEVKTRKSQFQVQADSLRSLPSERHICLKRGVARNALCLTLCAQRDLLRVSSCLPNRILEVEHHESFHKSAPQLLNDALQLLLNRTCHWLPVSSNRARIGCCTQVSSKSRHQTGLLPTPGRSRGRSVRLTRGRSGPVRPLLHPASIVDPS